MTLQSSGPISFSNINSELDGAGTFSIANTIPRTLVYKPTGSISASDFYGKSAKGWSNQTNPLTASYDYDNVIAGIDDFTTGVGHIYVRTVNRWNQIYPGPYPYEPMFDNNNSTFVTWGSSVNRTSRSFVLGRRFLGVGNGKVDSFHVNVTYLIHNSSSTSKGFIPQLYSKVQYATHDDPNADNTTQISSSVVDNSTGGIWHALDQMYINGYGNISLNVDFTWNINADTFVTNGQKRWAWIFFRLSTGNAYVEFRNTNQYPNERDNVNEADLHVRNAVAL
jgi:hypothetical protein